MLRSLERAARGGELDARRARQESIRNFREDGQASVTAFVTFRDRKGIFHNSLTCDQETREGVRCMIECDGGSFRLTRSGANSVLLHNNGFVLIGGCGEEVEEGQERAFRPGRGRQGVPARQPADRGLPRRGAEGHPDPGRASRCASVSRRTSSSASGATTTPRISQSNPKQMVTQIRVGRLAPGKERDDDSASKWWWFNVKLDVVGDAALEPQTTTVRYACSPREANWECTPAASKATRRRPAATAASSSSAAPATRSCSHNRHSGLPIDNECEMAQTGQQFPQRPLTRSDDRTFRLTRMPIRQCQL